jgi:hypothetical protein
LEACAGGRIYAIAAAPWRRFGGLIAMARAIANAILAWL